MKHLALLLLFIGCLNGQKNNDLGEFTTVPKSGDPFLMNDPVFDGKNLSVEIAYPGGCKEHLFQAKLESCDKDNFCTVFLHHNANDDTCEAMVSERYQFSLNEMGFKKEVPGFLLRPVFKNSKSIRVMKINLPK